MKVILLQYYSTRKSYNHFNMAMVVGLTECQNVLELKECFIVNTNRWRFYYKLYLMKIFKISSCFPKRSCKILIYENEIVKGTVCGIDEDSDIVVHYIGVDIKHPHFKIRNFNLTIHILETFGFFKRVNISFPRYVLTSKILKN